MKTRPVVYAFVSVATSAAEVWIASLSEYRFPYPLATAQIHLALSVGLVGLATFLLQTPGKHRSRPPVKSEPASEDSAAAQDSGTAARREQHRPRGPPPLCDASALRTQLAVVIPWLALLAIETYSRLRIDPAFWDLVRLVPLAVTLVPRMIRRKGRATLFKWHLLLVPLFMRSWRPAWSACHRDWLAGSAWAVAAVAWVIVLGTRNGSVPRTPRGPGVQSSTVTATKRLLRDLFWYTAVASAAAALSSEWTAIVRYRHFGFFTEVGFWLQELGMAACGVLRLSAFYSLAENCDTLAVFATAAVADRLHTRLLAAASGETLCADAGDGAFAAEAYQLAALVVFAGSALSRELWSSGMRKCTNRITAIKQT
ncbi:hypothetical protein JCM3774_000850 [Rhodotorula dairenensis]